MLTEGGEAEDGLEHGAVACDDEEGSGSEGGALREEELDGAVEAEAAEVLG